MYAKEFPRRVADLRSHAGLLSEACDRFIQAHKLDEVKNIGVRLRVLVGSGHGNGLLFDLAKETGDSFPIIALNQWGEIRITETEPSGEVIQEVVKRALITQALDRLPVLIAPGAKGALYVSLDLQEWIQKHFLIDWDVPQPDGGIKVVRFTPQMLINKYAGAEGAHSDAQYNHFGSPLETLSVQHVVDGVTLIVPVVFEFLEQIGRAVAHVANGYADKHNQAPS